MKTGELVILGVLAVGGWFWWQQRNAQNQPVNANQLATNPNIVPPSVEQIVNESWNAEPGYFGVSMEDIENTTEALAAGTYDPFYTNWDPNRYGINAYTDPANLGIGG